MIDCDFWNQLSITTNWKYWEPLCADTSRPANLLVYKIRRSVQKNQEIGLKIRRYRRDDKYICSSEIFGKCNKDTRYNANKNTNVVPKLIIPDDTKIFFYIYLIIFILFSIKLHKALMLLVSEHIVNLAHTHTHTHTHSTVLVVIFSIRYFLFSIFSKIKDIIYKTSLFSIVIYNTVESRGLSAFDSCRPNKISEIL
jgi:hypothetical protein